MVSTTMMLQYFTGNRLHSLVYVTEKGSAFAFTWFPYLQVWRGGRTILPLESWVTDDYGVLTPRRLKGGVVHGIFEKLNRVTRH